MFADQTINVILTVPLALLRREKQKFFTKQLIDIINKFQNACSGKIGASVFCL
jgi:hypothetical protein